jgi:hypothetical protein
MMSRAARKLSARGFAMVLLQTMINKRKKEGCWGGYGSFLRIIGPLAKVI